MNQPSSVVLDASAVLALINGETGAGVVASVIRRALISAVNHAEVVTRLADLGEDEERIRVALSKLPVQTVPFDVADAFTAGLLWPATRASGLPLAGRCCLALAKRRNLRVVTADRSWRRLNLGIDIQVLR